MPADHHELQMPSLDGDTVRAAAGPAAVDQMRPCGQDIARPEALWGKLVQGHRGRIGLTCNRPKGHDGPHRVYAATWTILADKAG